jgi:hypothetical protein
MRPTPAVFYEAACLHRQILVAPLSGRVGLPGWTATRSLLVYDDTPHVLGGRDEGKGMMNFKAPMTGETVVEDVPGNSAKLSKRRCGEKCTNFS